MSFFYLCYYLLFYPSIFLFTTGAALIAGLGANYFSGLEEVLEIAHSGSGEEWRPNMSTEKRADLVKKLQ